MSSYLFQDFESHGISRFKSIAKIITDRGYSSVFLFRLSSLCWKRKLKILSKIFFELNIFLNGCEVSRDVEIGTGLRIYHAQGIVIVATKIGKNFAVFQNVTVGRNKYPDHSGRYTPIIGDNVSFYTGCVVAGPVTIGDNVEVGANSVVTSDVGANLKATGNPCTISARKSLGVKAV